jgi:hypothetical protein
MREGLWLRVSPAGEFLSFAWPKERNQRKGHPWCVGLRLPCDARQPGRCGNSPWRAQTPRTSFPRLAALLGDTQGAPLRTPVPGHARSVSAGGRFSPPSALPIWRARAGKERNRARAPQHGAFCAPCQGELVERPPAHAKSGTRRAAMWGRLFFGYFLLAKQKKVTRPKAKSEAVAYPRTVKIARASSHTRPVKSTTRATSASEVTPSSTRLMPSSASGW